MSSRLRLPILRLRVAQLQRELGKAGPFLVAAALVGLGFLAHRLFTIRPDQALLINGAVLLSMFMFHVERRDLLFIRKHIERPWSNLALEYLCPILPIAVAQLGLSSWPLGALLVTTALLLPLLVVKRDGRVRGRWIRRMIPATWFEWRAAVQQFLPIVLVLWMAAVATSWLPVLPMLLLGLLSLLLLQVHTTCEPKAMLLATAPDADALLRTKLKGALMVTSLLHAPVLAAAVVFQTGLWWVYGLFLIGQLALVAYAVVLKYAHYVPNERLAGNEPQLTAIALFSAMPGLVVLPLLLFWRERSQARENLILYFDASDH